jgi:hypothetical protein
MPELRTERGVALVMAMAALLLMSAVTAGLVLITSFERAIAANYRNSVEALYAADAIAERVLAELATISEWDTLLTGVRSSSFIDGSPAGVRRLPDGGTVDLTQAVMFANCGKPITCSATDIAGNATGDRPWGPDNPVWKLFAYGPFAAIMPTVDSPFYVLVMIAGDPSERDGDPSRNGTVAGGPGTEIISLRAEAFGLRDAHKVIELTVGRALRQDEQGGQDGVGPVRVLSWRDLR